MPHTPRVAIVGAGTMGVMAAWRLALRGVPAVAFDGAPPGHEDGAAGGESRLFRVAYMEGRRYVPLLQRARRMWCDLQSESPSPLFLPVGVMTIAPAGHPHLREALASADAHGLAVQCWSGAEASRRFPQHRLDGETVLLDRDGGLLLPQDALRAAAAAATRRGAQIRVGPRVVEIRPHSRGVDVLTADGAETFDLAISALGPWTSQLWPPLAQSIEVRRVVLSWLRAAQPSRYGPQAFPPGVRRSAPDGDFSFFSSLDADTVKVNIHIPRRVLDDLDAVGVHEVESEYGRQVAATAQRYLPGLDPEPVRMRAFFDGYTPDGHGILGPHPDDPRIVLMGGFSGHGFKLSPAFGEAAADLVLTGRTDLDVGGLSPRRFLPAAPAARAPAPQRP